MKALSALNIIAATIAAILLLGSGSIYGLQTEQPETKRILVLFSYHEGLPWENLVDESLRNTLASQSTFLIEINMEHTNLVTYADDAYRHKLVDLYRYKYSRPKMDLIIGVGDEAVDMLLDYGEKLFPEIPTVLISGERKTLQRDFLKPNMTSLLWGTDIRASVELIREILPQTRHIFIVAGTSQTDRTALKRAQAALGQDTKRFGVRYLTDISADDLIKEAAQLPEQSALLFLVFFRDAEGKSFVPRKLLSILSKQASVPLFGLVDTYLGYGIVGGNLLSAEVQGKRCAEIAMRIFRGESPEDMIPERTLNQLMFDWRQLKRWGISEDKLPPGSIVRFKTYSFWDLYRGYIVAAFFLILLQSGLISFLLWQRAQRRRAEAKYRTVADFTYDWEYWANIDDSLEYVSPSCERISGYTTSDFIDNPSLFKEIIVPEDRDVWDRHYHNSRKELKPREIQFRIQRRDGQIRWIEHNCQPVIGHQGRLQGFRAGNRDITSRKLVEERIREREKDLRRLATQLISAHEEERRSLARELHDDLSQRLAALAIQAGRMEQQAVNKHALDAEECCGRLKDGIIAISNDVHSLSRQLHPSILEDLGLTRAVESLCARFSDRERIEVAFTAENIPGTLSRDVSLSIYRIIQEGLNNIAKHACASRVKVALQRTDGRLCLSIQDDGIGFDAAEVRQKPGLGLSSMRERVRVIHGVLRITSEPENGTTITVRVPLEKSSRMEATPTDSE
jgi:PAS domain S-box-containing protein